MIARFLIFALFYAIGGSLAQACQPFQPIPAAVAQPNGPNYKVVTFAKGQWLQLCDGQGYLSNTVSNVILYIFSRNGAAGFQIRYDYYNGVGTKGGYQNLIFTFYDGNGNPLPNTWPFGTERGGCTYNGNIGHFGNSNPDFGVPVAFDLISTVTMSADTVQGEQDGC